MTRWLWELRRARWRFGTFGWLALLLMVAATGVVVMEILPMRADLARRGEDLSRREAELKHAPTPAPDVVGGGMNADQRFSVFLHSFHAIASKHGLSIPQVTYQMATEDEASLRRYLVEATFTGAYLPVRMFVSDLRLLRGVRIERVSLSRTGIDKTQLDVRLKCSFLVEVSP